MDDFKNWIGFLTAGDASGALLIGPSDLERPHGFLNFSTFVDSAHVDKCYYYRDSEGLLQGRMQMGKLTYYSKKAVEKVADEIRGSKRYRTPDWVISHNTGRRSFQILENCGLGKQDRMTSVYRELGNITSASLPVNYSLLQQNEILERGHVVSGLFSGSGIVYGHWQHIH